MQIQVPLSLAEVVSLWILNTPEKIRAVIVLCHTHELESLNSPSHEVMHQPDYKEKDCSYRHFFRPWL